MFSDTWQSYIARHCRKIALKEMLSNIITAQKNFYIIFVERIYQKEKQKLYGPFLWIEPLRGGSLLFTATLPEIPGTPGTHLKNFDINFKVCHLGCLFL